MKERKFNLRKESPVELLSSFEDIIYEAREVWKETGKEKYLNIYDNLVGIYTWGDFLNDDTIEYLEARKLRCEERLRVRSYSGDSKEVEVITLALDYDKDGKAGIPRE